MLVHFCRISMPPLRLQHNTNLMHGIQRPRVLLAHRVRQHVHHLFFCFCLAPTCV